MKKIIPITIAILLIVGVSGYFLADNYKNEVYDFATNLGAQEAGLTKKVITINKHKLYYLENELKESKPTMCLVHGFGAFKENWIQLAIELRDDFHIVSIDLPGHGESDYFEKTNYDIDQQVTMLHEFANQVIGRPFYMTGNSMGGSITALYAASYPNDVKAALLLDPGHITDIKSPFNLQVENGVHPLIVENTDQFEILVNFAMEQPPFLPWPMTEVSTQKMAERKHKNEKIWVDITENPSYNFKAEITNIKAPTLIAWGKEDRVLHYKNAYIFDQLIPNSTVKIFEQVGHAPMIEIPKVTAQTLIEFINNNSSEVSNGA